MRSYNTALGNFVDKISNYYKKYEVGNILGGKPFTMRTSIPYIETIKKESSRLYIDFKPFSNTSIIIKSNPLEEFQKLDNKLENNLENKLENLKYINNIPIKHGRVIKNK